MAQVMLVAVAPGQHCWEGAAELTLRKSRVKRRKRLLCWKESLTVRMGGSLEQSKLKPIVFGNNYASANENAPWRRSQPTTFDALLYAHLYLIHLLHAPHLEASSQLRRKLERLPKLLNWMKRLHREYFS